MPPPFPNGGAPPARDAPPPPRDVDQRTRDLQAPSTKLIVASEVDPRADLRRERSTATFPARELAALLAGGEDKLTLREKVGDAVRGTEVFSKKGKYFMERADLYRTTLEKYLALPKLASDLQKRGVGDAMQIARIIREMIDEPGGLDLHLGMFIPTIQGQGTKEQQAYWMPRCLKLKVIGTYAQTELGHGTYIRGLETTATFDALTQQFIIHSPTLTSTKWWPGGMGKTSTHAIVMARLLVTENNKLMDKGPHAFVVQIRSNENHETMPGVTAGDIGPKMGYNAVDNGFLRFDHVRVNRNAMMMKHSQVDENGVYHPPPVAKAAYGTMVFVRSDIVMNAALYMKKAVVIATRYNLVRRQSNPGSGVQVPAPDSTSTTPKTPSKTQQLEAQVIDYQHSQRSLFPILAKAFAFHCTSDYMRRMYFEYEKQSRTRQDFSALPELHATSSGLKAYCSWATKDAIELCRLCCGGQGFMALAGFGTTFGNYAPNATYEGDNNVLCLQTSRYLLKVTRAAEVVARHQRHTGSGTLDTSASIDASAQQMVTAAAEGAARYLLEPPTKNVKHRRIGRDLDSMLAAYAHAARRQIFAAARRAGSLPADQAMQRDMVAWIKAAKAHCAYVVLWTFKEAVSEVRQKKYVGRSTQAVMERLVALHGLTTMDDGMGDFLEDGYLDTAGAEDVRNEITTLLAELRPDAAALTDAFALDDYFLNSALGASDGDVYARLLQEVQDAPFNKKHTPPGYETLLRERLRKGIEGSSKL